MSFVAAAIGSQPARRAVAIAVRAGLDPDARRYLTRPLVRTDG